MDLSTVEQRSEEWHEARLGKVTASRVADMMARTKSGPSASRKNYRAELVLERLTGQRQGGHNSAAMQWGTDVEPQARAAYEFLTDRAVVETGFVVHPRIADLGASPDGLVGDDGLLEIKCPIPATHLEIIETGAIPDKYIKQMQTQMACTGRAWCDFVSFDPRFPAEHQIWMHRVQRDDALIAEIEREAVAFLAEVEAVVAKLNQQKEAA